MNNSNPKIYCLAPWVHAHVNSMGKRALCCSAGSFDLSKDSFDEYWNGPEMRAIRVSMMKGELSSEYCGACLGEPNSNGKPLDNFSYALESKNALFSETSEEGRFEGSPTHFDYRTSNICNLSCRMCNAESSSKIESALLNVRGSEKEVQNLNIKKKLDSEIYYPELRKALESGVVERLYFASGESMIQQEHWEFLDRAIELKHASQIDLTYNTNLAYPIEILEKNITRFKEFKSVKFRVSIDGAEDGAEFIRDGVTWNLFCKNLDRAIQNPHISLENFQITLTIPTLIEMNSFVRFLNHYDSPILVLPCFPEGLSGLLSPICLGREDLDRVLENAIEEIEKLKHENHKNAFLDCIKLIRTEHKPFETDFAMELMERSDLLDDQFGRSRLSDYYRKKEIASEWTTGKIDLEKYLGLNKGSSSDPFFDEVHTLNSPVQNTVRITHQYQDISNFKVLLEELRERNIKFVSIVGSNPGALSLFFSSRGDKKFLMYSELVESKNGVLRELDFLNVIESKPLGLFKYIFRNSQLSILGKFLDGLFFPFRKSLGFHHYLLLEIKPLD